MMSHEMSQVIAYLLFSVTCRMSPNFLRPFYFQYIETEKSIKSKLYWNLSCSVHFQGEMILMSLEIYKESFCRIYFSCFAHFTLDLWATRCNFV